jgi:hypothetical protein
MYLAGCVALSTGAAFFIHSNLGTDPLDVFSLGPQEQVPVTIGIAQATAAAICIAIWSLWHRRRPAVAVRHLLDLREPDRPADVAERGRPCACSERGHHVAGHRPVYA